VSLYAQDAWSLNPRLQLTAGVRWDHYSDFGDTVNPRLGFLARLPRDLHLKLLYGRAFRAPSFIELHFAFPGFVGNPDLEPSIIHTFEAALGYRRRNLRVSANVYANFLRDFIAAERPLTPAADSRFVNTSGIDAQGVEVELRRSFGPRSSLFANYSYQHAEERATSRRVPSVPSHLANLGGTVALGEHLSLTPTLRLRSSRPRQAIDPRPAMDGTGLLDLNLRVLELYRTLELSATLFNLLDREYASPAPSGGVPGDYPRPGVSALFRARYRF
jgi:iron complex outermembrane receptor protein